MSQPAGLRPHLAGPETGLLASCTDPLTALILQDLGLRAIYVGGFATGAVAAVTEPLLSLTEMVEFTAKIARVVSVPILCDAGAGWGDAIHVMRTVQEFERVGAGGIHIEDQLYPKEMRYHTLPAPQEDMISAERMCTKIEAAVEARTRDDFAIIARTDAVAANGGSFQEAVRRANLYAEAGADGILAFPETMEQTAELPRQVSAPLIYVVTEGRHHPRPSVSELHDFGYRLVIHSAAMVLIVVREVRRHFERLLQTGASELDGDEMREIRRYVNGLLRVPERIGIETRSRGR